MSEEEHRRQSPACAACGGSRVEALDFRASGSYRIFECAACGLKFLDCQDESDAPVDEYWDDVNEVIYRDRDVVRELQDKFSRHLGRIRERAPNMRLLDVGSGAGIFLDSARKAGFDVVGVEPSTRAVALATSIYEVPVICDLLKRGDGLPKDFGVITLWDVIEHVPYPGELIATCAEHLADNGLLVLETPEEGSLLRKVIWWLSRVSGGRIELRSKIYYRAHRYYFTRKAIKMLLAQSGFDDVECFTDHTMFEKSLLKLKMYRGLSRNEERTWRAAYWVLKKASPFANKMVVIGRKTAH